MNPKSHRQRAFVTFLITILAAGTLLPLIRVQPESLHQYLNGLNDWIRIAFAFTLSLMFTGAMFKLLKPRARQLKHWWSYPPAWLAVLLALAFVAIIDVLGGFDHDGYRATTREWLIYGLGSFLLVGFYAGLLPELIQWSREEPKAKEEAKEEASGVVTLQDIKNAPWEEIEAWLASDEPAKYDFISNQSIAHRVSFLISEGTRSVGIAGRFGAGKTSIVRWAIDRLKKRELEGCRYFVCHHSCWGFETSASAIHDMLDSAVSQLGEVIDTFQVDSLPESYRQTFSAGGDWFEAISNLVLHTSDPMEQFSHLSNLLGDIGGRLVFIVEDLDRNETRNFEIQEVLAFLERLKEYPNLSFVLTAGLSSSQHIDFPKLCDHIEFLRLIKPSDSSALIERVRDRCLDNAFFPHVRVVNPNRNYEWSPLSGLFFWDTEEFPLPQAVAALLKTPRSLRHALGRTFSAWRTLHGEIDFGHLLAVNVLRFGAPECLEFLMHRWDRLHSLPRQNNSFGQDREKKVRQAIVDEWNRIIQGVEWNPAATLQVAQFILPSIEYWLVDDAKRPHILSGQQYVSEERYWIRAFSEAVEQGDVRDQEVMRDILDWLNDHDIGAELVKKLTTLPKYADLWRNLAGGFFANRRDDILLLCEQVIHRILSKHGVNASSDSSGFVVTWAFATQNVLRQPDNERWLNERITAAASVSIPMVNALWHYYGSPGRHSILTFESGEPVRRHILNTIKAIVTDGPSLVAKLSPNDSNALYQLVFDPGSEGDKTLVGVQSWKWLAPYILASLKDRNVIVAANCGVLLGARVSGRERMTVDTEVLDEFFGTKRPRFSTFLIQ